MRAYKFFMSLDDKEIEPHYDEWAAKGSQGIVAHGKDPERVHEADKGMPFMDYID